MSQINTLAFRAKQKLDGNAVFEFSYPNIGLFKLVCLAIIVPEGRPSPLQQALRASSFGEVTIA
jgi:hypothetical protein